MSTIKAPQGIVWAFNPYYVEIESSTEDTVQIAIGDCTIDVALYNGKARAYVSRMIQLLFNEPVEQRGVKADIYVYGQNSVILSQTEIFAVWGAVEIGEHLPGITVFEEGEKNWMEFIVPYFINFPFTLDLLMLEGMTYRTRKDKSGYSESESVESSAMVTLVGGDDIPNDMQHRWVIRQDTAPDGGPFDKTFDYTFRLPADSTIITKVVPRTEQEGFYLRWVDRFGFMRYYLFDKGEKTYKTNPSEYKKSAEKPVGGMYYGGFLRDIGITTEVTQKMCAVGLDEGTLAMVETIVSATVVDLYKGHAVDGTELWLPVTVDGGSYNVSVHHSPLQDFEITVKLPNRFTQTL